VAEEIATGELTTGAADDFRQATSLAHAMVVEWGMSETMGPLSYGEREESILPFMPGPRRGDYSEQTAKEIDVEVRRIVMEQYERIKKLLLENRDKLDAVATALLERETLDREEIEAVMEGRELPERKRIEVPRYSEKSRKRREKRKEPIFQPRPREVPTGS
jgi:cell division protease FtsH